QSRRGNRPQETHPRQNRKRDERKRLEGQHGRASCKTQSKVRGIRSPRCRDSCRSLQQTQTVFPPREIRTRHSEFQDRVISECIPLSNPVSPGNFQSGSYHEAWWRVLSAQPRRCRGGQEVEEAYTLLQSPTIRLASSSILRDAKLLGRSSRGLRSRADKRERRPRSLRC